MSAPQTPERVLRRLLQLTDTALTKTGKEHDKIVIAVGKILVECVDEAYEQIGDDPVLLDNLARLNIDYGFED